MHAVRGMIEGAATIRTAQVPLRFPAIRTALSYHPRNGPEIPGLTFSSMKPNGL
jgi:hypothetical protein